MAAAAGLPPVPGGAPRASTPCWGSAAQALLVGMPMSASRPPALFGTVCVHRWSAVSRTERYRKRLEENGEDVSALGE